MSFLAMWNVQAKMAASKKHDEFAGRLKYGNKAELYKTAQQPRWVRLIYTPLTLTCSSHVV